MAAHRCLRTAIVGFCASGLAACAVTTTSDRGGAARPDPGTALAYGADRCAGRYGSVVRVEALGLSSQPGMSTLGFAQSQIACLPQHCQIVFLVSDPRQLGKVEEIVRQTSNACAFPWAQGKG